MRELNQVLIDKYSLLLSQKSNKRHTVESLKLKIGDKVWIRIIKFSPRFHHLKHLLPRWKLAEIVEILGMTSLLLKDCESGRIVSRHLVDVAPVLVPKSYRNLYTDSLTANKNEIEEDFQGVGVNEIPNLDGEAIAMDLETPNYRERLRKREPKNYKE